MNGVQVAPRVSIECSSIECERFSRKLHLMNNRNYVGTNMKTSSGPLCSDLKLVAMLAATLSPAFLAGSAWAQEGAPSLPSFAEPAEEDLDPVQDLQQQIQDLRVE